jgi:FlaA1/EpsC-like NDP-sugar epimerase
MESLEDYDEIVYLVPQSKTVLDSIAKKIFEDPYYQDKMFVEDRKHKEKEEIVDFPVFSFFSHIFEQYNDNKIILNLSSLTFEERRNLLGIE